LNRPASAQTPEYVVIARTVALSRPGQDDRHASDGDRRQAVRHECHQPSHSSLPIRRTDRTTAHLLAGWDRSRSPTVIIAP